MTVSTTLDRQYFNGNGVTVAFPFNFRFFDNSNIYVSLIAPDATVTLLTMTSHYTVSGALAATGGTVTMLTAPAVGYRLLIQRVLPQTQPTSIRNQGAYFPAIHEDVFDRLTMLFQQAASETNTSLKLDLSGLRWDFMGYRGINAADPVNAQDVVTKNWAASYIDSVSGLINTTVGIAYDGGTLFDYLRFGVGRAVDSIATLRGLDSTRNQRAFVLGYYAKGDGGGGVYYIDPADITSLDNGGTIIVATDGSRWKLAVTSSVSFKQFGAKGDGIANDTTSMQSAFDALGGSVKLTAPKGVYLFTKLTFDGAVGLTIEGDGAINTTTFRCTSTLATDGLKLRSVFDCTASFITFDHSSTGFTGYLVELNHKPVAPTDTQGMYFFRCTFASQGFNKYTAKGVNLNQSTLVTFEGCKFGSLLRPIDGQNSAGGGYANGIRFKDCQSFDNVGYFANYLGEHWTFQDCNFQACQDGAQRICFSDNTTVWRGLAFINCTVYDATAIGPSMLNLGTGSGITVENGLWGGRGDLGSTTWLNATGVVTAVNAKGTTFSMFTNIGVAGVAGCLGWNISGGNAFIPITGQPISATTMLVNRANAPDARFDNNAPNVSLRDGTGPTSNWRTYNPDGTCWIGGQITGVGAAATGTLTYPLGACSATLTVRLGLKSPGADTNTVAEVGDATGSAFQYRIGGTGLSTVVWSALVIP